jgi:hypothetical protein
MQVSYTVTHPTGANYVEILRVACNSASVALYKAVFNRLELQ